jgi:hypothetical protein
MMGTRKFPIARAPNRQNPDQIRFPANREEITIRSGTEKSPTGNPKFRNFSPPEFFQDFAKPTRDRQPLPRRSLTKDIHHRRKPNYFFYFQRDVG